MPRKETTIDRLLIGLVLAVSLHAFDDLAMSTILPTIAAELRGDGLYGASFLAFLLTNLASLVATGYFIDRIGVARPFAAGIVLFVAGLVLGFVATSMPIFVLGRALQGLGGGTVQAVVSAVVVIAWSGAARQRAISWVTTAWMVPALIGPLLAGWIAVALHWRYVFAALALLAIATAVVVFPRLLQVASRAAERVPAAGSDAEPLPLATVIQALRVAVGTGIVLGGLDAGGAIGLALALGGVLVTRRPLAASLPDGFWTARTPLGAVLLLRMLACAVFFGIEAWLPWTVTRSGLASPITAGLILSCAAGGWTAATWWVDGAIARLGARPILSVASVLLVAGCALAWFAAVETATVALLFVAWTVAGSAMGLCYPVISALAMARAERGREGRLSMMLGLTDTLGVTCAIGLGGAFLRADLPGALERIGGVWLGLLAVALLLPALLTLRPRHFERGVGNEAGGGAL